MKLLGSELPKETNRHGQLTSSDPSRQPCRIIEVTLDQFYAMQLPMRSSLLRGLTVGFDSALQQYVTKLLAQAGDREDLIPPAPALTRFKKDVVTKVRQQVPCCCRSSFRTGVS